MGTKAGKHQGRRSGDRMVSTGRSSLQARQRLRLRRSHFQPEYGQTFPTKHHLDGGSANRQEAIIIFAPLTVAGFRLWLRCEDEIPVWACRRPGAARSVVSLDEIVPGWYAAVRADYATVGPPASSRGMAAATTAIRTVRAPASVQHAVGGERARLRRRLDRYRRQARRCFLLRRPAALVGVVLHLRTSRHGIWAHRRLHAPGTTAPTTPRACRKAAAKLG